ncbi:hypothetical protein XELAEV_18038573mg [Xenopus laevis]|uniref:Uncharacterized protein n=1 Tax=Xenopus laevis TaxID=8355 RepID=A0A974C671_XENLA|nr:hypothetical protein XELAEV_18038573mg [Xenopus laevis]
MFNESRSQWLHKHKISETESQNGALLFIKSYIKQYCEVKRIVNKYLPVLNGDDKLRKVLQHGCKFVIRRVKTLGNILSPSDVCVSQNTATWLNTTGSFGSGATRCITCRHMVKSGEFVSSSTKKVHKIRSFINRNNPLVIYLLTCAKCEIQYVGCTSRKLKCHMCEHIGQIASRSSSTVVTRHFLDCGEIILRLLHREAYWIFTLDTRQPKGLNSRFDVAGCV